MEMESQVETASLLPSKAGTGTPANGACLCSFCHAPSAHAYKVGRALLRYVCEPCFENHCLLCGGSCVDQYGDLLPGVKRGARNALFCEECLSAPRREHLVEHI